MAGRSVQIDLIGKNTSALKAINEVAAASEKAAAQSAASFDKHTSKIGGLFKSLDNQLANFGVPLTGALSVVGAKFDETGGKASTFHDKVSALGGASLIGAAAGLALVGTEAVHLADDFEKSHARLETAVKNVGQSFDEESSKISATDSKLEKLGFTNADTENSLSRLVVATKDVGQATNLMGLAADIARARGIDLASATDLLVKVEAGRFTQLTRLGIATSAQVKGFKDSAEAVDFLTQKFGGQAQAYAKTFAGELETLKATGEDLAVGLGQHLIPVIEDSVGVLNSGVHAFEAANSATDGWLGKVTLAAAAVPALVFVYDKASAGLGALTTAYGRAATAVGIKTAADETQVATQAQLVTTSEAAAVAQAQLAIAEGKQAAAVGTAVDAQVAFDAALAEFESAAPGDIAAATALAKAYDAMAAASARAGVAAGTAGKAIDVSLAADEAVSLERTGAAAAQAASQLGTVGAEAGVAGGSLAGLAGPVGIAAAAFLGVGIAARNIFPDSFTAKVKQAADDLTKVDAAADKAKATLTDLIGPQATANVVAYSDALLSGADAHTLAGLKAEAHADAERRVVAAVEGSTFAAKLNDTQIHNLVLSREDLTNQLANEAHGYTDATSELDKLNKQYGAAAIQTAALRGAQKAYADDLAKGGVAEATLAADKQAVIDAASKEAATQNQVTAATQQGTDAASGNADALNAQANATTNTDDALKKLFQDTLSARDANLSEQTAVLGVQDAQQRLAEAELKVIATKGQDTQANRDLETALIAGKSAINQVAEAHAKAGDSAQQQEDALKSLQGFVAPGSPLRAYLDGLISDLDRAAQPRHGTLDISVNIPTGTITETVSGVPVAAPINFRRQARGGPNQPGLATLVGEEGPELVVFSQPGMVYPAAATKAMLSRAGGGPVAPFGSLQDPGNISVQFNRGSSSTPSNVTAIGQLLSTQDAISQYAQTVTTDLQNVKTATDNTAKAWIDLALATKAVHEDDAHIALDFKDIIRLQKEHASAAQLKIATDRLAADESKRSADVQKQNETSGTFKGAEKAEQEAKAALKAAQAPKNIAALIAAQVSQEKQFAAAENTLIRFGDVNLARLLAESGPDQALTAAVGLAGSKADADKAEAELKVKKATDADLNAVYKKLGISPKALGGPFGAGDRLLVGEYGPELVQFPSAGRVIPNNQISGGSTVVIHAPRGAILDGRWVVQMLQEEVLMRGPIKNISIAA